MTIDPAQIHARYIAGIDRRLRVGGGAGEADVRLGAAGADSAPATGQGVAVPRTVRSAIGTYSSPSAG